MGRSGAAALAIGLWVLPSAPGALARRPCVTPALVPQEEGTLSWGPRKRSIRPKRNPPRPSSCAMLRRVARDLADAQAVLSSLPSPELFPGVGQTLELLAAAGRDVAACLELARPGSWRRSPRRPGRRPKTRRAESPRCHEATVIFHLLRLLAWDLRLVAHAGPCL
nr:interferon lambda-4-like [Bubalus bubalis]